MNRHAKSLNISLTILILVLSGSCRALREPTAEERLRELNIEQETFASLSTCGQIEIYAEVGRHYIDEGHFAVIVPTWVDEAIDRQRHDTVMDCIVREGYRRLEQLSDRSDEREAASFAIHALAYKAYNLEALNLADFRLFLNEAVCEYDLKDPFNLLVIEYISENGKPPSYLTRIDAEEQMRLELCGK